MKIDKLIEYVYNRGYEDGYEDGENNVIDSPGHIEWSFESFMENFKTSEAYLSVSNKT